MLLDSSQPRTAMASELWREGASNKSFQNVMENNVMMRNELFHGEKERSSV